MRKSKKMLSALLALSFVFAAGGAVAVIGSHEGAIAVCADETEASIDVTESVTITDVNASWWERDYNAYWLKISLGGKNLLPKDGGKAYYANDNPNKNGVDLAEYIYINDASVRSALTANANGTTSYKGVESPLSNGGVFAPVSVYDNGTEIEIKILQAYVNNTKNFEITLKSGFSWENSDGEVLTTTKDITYDYESGALAPKVVRTDVSLNDAFFVRSTQVATGDSMIYTIDSSVKFFAEASTWLMDHYTDLQEVICINGKTVKEINDETDDSAYEYTEFPGTLGDVYAVPVRVNVGYENEATRINVYIHNDYLAANEIASIGVKSGFEMKDAQNAYKVTEDQVFYAHDNTFAKKCTVYFDGEEKTGYIGHGIPAVSVPTNPTKESTATTDYTFSGWYIEDGDAWDWETKLEGDVKLVSHYNESARKYTITYYNENGTVFETQEVANGAMIEKIAAPDKQGYTASWTSTYEENMMPTEDIAYTVQYKIITYTLVFKADGEVVDTKTYTIEEADVVEPVVPEKEGCTGVWGEYTKFSAVEITVEAIYTEIGGNDSSSSEEEDSSSSEIDDSSSSEVGDTSSTEAEDSSSSKKDDSSSSVAGDSSSSKKDDSSSAAGDSSSSKKEDSSSKKDNSSAGESASNSTIGFANPLFGSCNGSVATLPVAALGFAAVAILKKKRK